MYRLQLKLLWGILAVLPLCTVAQSNRRLERQEKTLIINRAISMIRNYYIFQDRIDGIVTHLKGKLARNDYDTFYSQETFLESLNEDLYQFGHDCHLKITYGPKRVQQIVDDEKSSNEGKEKKMTDEWLHQLEYENFRIKKLERLEGNIGYFEFLNFTPLIASEKRFAQAMDFLKYSNAIIIDLRRNTGGDIETINFLLSYFLKDSSAILELKGRNGKDLTKFFTSQSHTREKVADNIPLYILVSNKTASAAEGFTYTLQQYKRAVVFGEQTKGEGNPGNLFAINTDLYIMIPTSEAINPISKKSIDGVGVIPDIKISEKQALTRGLLGLYSLLAETTSDLNQRLMFQWQIPLLENELNPEPLTDTITQFLIGSYEGKKKIINQNGQVFYINGVGLKEKLNYIGKGIFQNEHRAWIRLVVPCTEQPISYFTWIWDDGSTPQIVNRIYQTDPDKLQR